MPACHLPLLALATLTVCGCATHVAQGAAAPLSPQFESDHSGSAPTNRIEIAGVPEWLRIRLADYDAQTDRSAPRAVYAVNYGGGTAYYVASGCCDQFDPLIDANGVLICHPTGGSTGRGDQKCPSKLPPENERREVWRHR